MLYRDVRGTQPVSSVRMTAGRLSSFRLRRRGDRFEADLEQR
jgi:hypothetical protein